MAGLPREKAGIGSAVNDTARELGGTLGVAAMGSLFASLYSRTVGAELAQLSMTEEQVKWCQGSVAAGMHAAKYAGKQFGSLAEDAIRNALIHGFLDGLHAASWLGAGFLFAGAVGCFWVLPPRNGDGFTRSVR
jgi:hypothetical protein